LSLKLKNTLFFTFIWNQKNDLAPLLTPNSFWKRNNSYRPKNLNYLSLTLQFCLSTRKMKLIFFWNTEARTQTKNYLLKHVADPESNSSNFIQLIPKLFLTIFNFFFLNCHSFYYSKWYLISFKNFINFHFFLDFINFKEFLVFLDFINFKDFHFFQDFFDFKYLKNF
jgi:hypothetical protein